jgi:DNA repair protein RAD57
MDLDDVPSTSLTSKQRAHLKKAGFTTTHEVLCCPTSALQRRTGLPSEDVEACVLAIALHRMPACVSAADAYRAPAVPKMSTGAGHAFDTLVGGAIRTGSITEIVGESCAAALVRRFCRSHAHSATGKSNFCMQLAIQAQLPVELGGLAASALYLTSETSQSAFPSNRLLEIARTVRTAIEGAKGAPTQAELLANVHLGNAADFEALDLILAHHARGLATELRARRKPRLGLLIVDSIAAPSRADFATNTISGLNDRAKALSLLSDLLKRLACDLKLAVVVVNQVSDVFSIPLVRRIGSNSLSSEGGGSLLPPPPRQTDDDDELELSYDAQARFFDGQAPALHKQAALGLVWANAVDTRLMFSLTRRQHRSEGAAATIRRATLVFSPFAPPGSVDYIIGEPGLIAVSDVYSVGDRWPIKAAQMEEEQMRADLDEEALWASVKLNSDAEFEVQVP